MRVVCSAHRDSIANGTVKLHAFRSEFDVSGPAHLCHYAPRTSMAARVAICPPRLAKTAAAHDLSASEQPTIPMRDRHARLFTTTVALVAATAFVTPSSIAAQNAPSPQASAKPTTALRDSLRATLAFLATFDRG